MRDFEDRLALFESIMRGNIPVRDYDTLLKWCVENEFFSQPASTKYHGNYPEGLFDHSYNVADALCVLTQIFVITWERSRTKRNGGNYTRAIHKYPNVLWTHHADMIAAHIIER